MDLFKWYRSFVALLLTTLVLVACGGSSSSGGTSGSGGTSSSGGGDIINDGSPGPLPIEGDFFTLEMSPLQIIGYSDDTSIGKYPAVDLRGLANSQELLIRVRDPFAKGSFYSLSIGLDSGPLGLSRVSPLADESDNEPDFARRLLDRATVDRGLVLPDPLLDEDWLVFTAADNNCCYYLATGPNLSGSAADPVLEVYDADTARGPITYTPSTSDANDRVRLQAIHDPTNNRSILRINRYNAADDRDINSFFVIFQGSPVPGNHAVVLAAPPLPTGQLNSAFGTVHVERFDAVGGQVVGSVELAITDTMRRTEITGHFRLPRLTDRPGMLDAFEPAATPSAALELILATKLLAD